MLLTSVLDQILVMFSLLLGSMCIHYHPSRNHIPIINSDTCVGLDSHMLILILDIGLGLGLELWCSGSPFESGKNVDDIPRSSIVEGSSNSTQYIWLYFKQSHSFLT